MRVVNAWEVRRRLGAYVRCVRGGEEVVITQRGMPVARILPVPASISEQELRLVASGVLKLPEEEVKDWNKFWDEFFAIPGPNLSQEEMIKAVLDEREESH